MKRHYVLLIVLLGLITVPAYADPAALRGPSAQRSVTVALGAPEISAALWLDSRIGVAMDWRWPDHALGAAVGTRRIIIGNDGGWGIDAYGAAGLIVPIHDRGLAVSATGALLGGYRGKRARWVLGPVTPAAWQFLGGLDARLPLTLEMQAGAAIGPVWLGGQLSGGLVLAPGQSWSLDGQASVTLTWMLGQMDTR